MKRYTLWLLILTFFISSCGSRSGAGEGERVITVTIPPFAWFVEAIAGDDFRINVMLPAGADHHIWEPLPAQINSLSGSEAFIMNGLLGFEEAWMDRFLQVSPDMKILDLSRNIQLIEAGETESVESESGETLSAVEQNAGVSDDHEVAWHEADSHDGANQKGSGQVADSLKGENQESPDHEAHNHEGESHDAHGHGGPDPHYWMSPLSARVMADDIRSFLTELNPDSSAKYEANLAILNRRISEVDSLVRQAMATASNRTVMIYHPALAYMGRDYGFEQVSFEDEGKSPSPARMKELIDLARAKKIKTIFIQAEYDLRNAQSLSKETGAKLIVINPMNRNWPEAVVEVAQAIGSSSVFSLQSSVGSHN
jgi:zinc transport system substrate-binding protein